MKTTVCLLLATAVLGVCTAPAQDNGVKEAGAITKALTKTILVPKGMDAKSARVRAREARHIDLQAIHFKFDSTELADAASYRQLAELGKALNDPSLGDCVITLEGHTDDQGADAYNLDLSRRRAEAVKLILTTQHNIPEARLQTVGKGKSEPVMKDTSEFARAQNRRVAVIREP